MRVLNACALNCGPGAVLVEDGPTNGAVTYALLQSLAQYRDQRLVVLGERCESCQRVIDASGVKDRVQYELGEEEPMMWFVGDTDPAGSVARAKAAKALAIFLYDINTSRYYGLGRFAENDRVARMLKDDPQRGHHWLDATVQTQQTRRGMLVSTLIGESREPLKVEEPVVVAEQPPRGVRFRKL